MDGLREDWLLGGDVGAIGDKMMVMDLPFATYTGWFDAGLLTKW